MDGPLGSVRLGAATIGRSGLMSFSGNVSAIIKIIHASRISFHGKTTRSTRPFGSWELGLSSTSLNSQRKCKEDRGRKCSKAKDTMACSQEVVKYGIIGVGMMGREHLINLYHLQDQGVSVVCIADPHIPSQQLSIDLAQSFNWSLKVFSGHKELLDSGLCDVVVVSTPNMTHYQILMDVINHPKPHHILVEKPLCTTVTDCKKIIDAARRRPEILVQVGLEYRYMPPVAKLIEIVKGGKIGQVKMVAIREHRFPFLVKVENWNRFNCNSGGTLVEKCCHFFDLMRLFVGADPVRVMASGSIDVNHKDEVYDGKVPDIIDNSFVIVEFSNGSRGMLDLCMFAEGSKNEQEISVVGDIGKGEAFVPEGIVRVGARAEGRDGVHTLKAEDKRIKYDGLHHGSSYLEHLNFLSAVRVQGARTPAVDLQDGLFSVAMGVAGQLSIERGQFVTIEEVVGGGT